jgi:glycosyltransferase involved in cell wall biosynthesis
MKILHVETGRHLYGGAQQVLYLTRALTERGIDNTLVCLPDSEIDQAARKAGVSIENLKCAGDHDLAFAFRLRQRLLAQKPDIIHCHSRRGGDFLGGLAATGTSIPAVISRRVDNTESPLIAGLRYRPFCKIIAISEAIACVLREAGLDEDRLTVIRDAVDTERFMAPADQGAFRAEFGLSGAEFVVAVIAQLIPRKGHRYLLEAVAQLKASYPQLKVIIFGQGPLETELRERTAKLGLSGLVQFAGFRRDLDDYLACLDLLVHPALAEGLGVAVLKAAAAGVPVVGFAAGGLSEAVVDGETGLLVPPKDAVALRGAIARLVENPALRRELGEAGRIRMQSDFSIAAMVDDHVQLYESILSGGP